MAKQHYNKKETQVATDNGMGKQLEQTVVVDDNSLPSPQELAAYQAIDPEIVKFLIETAKKEQEHRHETELKKLDLVKKVENRITWIDGLGLMFAFLSIAVLGSIVAYALHLNQQWIAGILGGTTIATVASIFIRTYRHDPRSKE
ncbi:MAG: DUF2335 domain-containing protein [Phocaeicola sp.]